ncbi:MAG: ribosome small subunit-dependent GTPase A [Ignavibacteriae bacterium HGW-Ignavibacteriae-2]|nr:MAG: ribosome small subunit-dependent GTPase A [Ignavibacteriae bacterium HGW-Ignavibacteriae-2]
MESKDYYVESENGNIIRCNLRGKFKKQFELKKDKQYILDVAVVGDFVDIEMNEDGTGSIHFIHERKNCISRKAPRIKGAAFRGERLEQKIASNVDDMIIVTSAVLPMFNNKALDRLIVIAESSHINPIIVINKIDLVKDELDYWAELYTQIGYKVFVTSVVTGQGIKELAEEIKGKVNVFWGASGVGKSSLLNKLFPELDLRVGEISSSSKKGTHTTVTVLLKKVAEDTYIVDTPGIREIEPYGIKKEDLAHYLKEFSLYLNDCRFNTCTHFHEPGCAVIDAVENELISLERYESYLNMLDTIEEDINF